MSVYSEDIEIDKQFTHSCKHKNNIDRINKINNEVNENYKERNNNSRPVAEHKIIYFQECGNFEFSIVKINIGKNKKNFVCSEKYCLGNNKELRALILR